MGSIRQSVHKECQYNANNARIVYRYVHSPYYDHDTSEQQARNREQKILITYELTLARYLYWTFAC